MTLQGQDYSFLKHFSLPIVIHAEHQIFGVNIADLTKHEHNLKSISFAIKIADLTGAKKIILHPGVIKNKDCSMKNAINFLREIGDERIIVENLFKRGDKELNFKGLCGTSGETKRFIKKKGIGFCFDINHSLEGIKNFKGNYDFIRKYIKLNPSHYHIGGQKMNASEGHLYFKNSELDLKKILSYYPQDAEITLETGVDEKLVEEDLETIRKISEELKII